MDYETVANLLEINRPNCTKVKGNLVKKANVSHKKPKLACNIVNEIPLAFTELKQHQMSDKECKIL